MDPREPFRRLQPGLQGPVTFDFVQDLICRRMKHGKTSLKLQVASPQEVEVMGEWYAGLPGFTSKLITKRYSTIDGREAFTEYFFVVSWVPEVPNRFVLLATERETTYVGAPVETTTFKVEHPAYSSFKPEILTGKT